MYNIYVYNNIYNMYMYNMYNMYNFELETENIQKITLKNNLIMFVSNIQLEYLDKDNKIAGYVKKNRIIFKYRYGTKGF